MKIIRVHRDGPNVIRFVLVNDDHRPFVTGKATSTRLMRAVRPAAGRERSMNGILFAELDALLAADAAA